ncbi:IgGFc-binding protein-like isoform X2 [Ostrea edulis]|uniref:IgGFc-binding protein-like isoform X2 n=1 Tax=Ostrea edulis TaxID=37623 RepID=UPI0024AF643A|nr:IgGFc-binding protein-like isoform X2 [Ostrea edulis]
MNGKVKNMDDLNTRLHLLEGSMQNLFVSVNTSLENIRENLNASRIPQVNGSLEISSDSGVTLSSPTETTITTPAATQVPTSKGTESNLNPTSMITISENTQVTTSKGTKPNLNPKPTTTITTPATTQVPTSKGTEPNLNPTTTITTPATTQVPTSKGSRGREFLILFMRNHPFARGSLNIYVSSDSGVMANISSSPKLDATIKLAVDRRLNITHNSKFTLPANLACEYGTVEPKTVILQTSEPATVTILDSFHKQSNDATLIIPTDKLSNKYFVSTTHPYRSSSDFYSQFAVGALYNGTNINVTFKMKDTSPISLLGGTYRDGDVFSVTLERLETFQVGHATDLSGTVITSSKPVAVFSGNRCNQLKSGACSHMLTQLPPVSELDNQYIVPPFYNNKGTLIQVISESQNTVNCSVGDRVSTWLLGDTEYKNVEVTPDEISVIVSDRPVLVTGFGMGGSYDSYMTVIPGVHQYLNYYKVVVPGGYDENFFCVMISSESVNSLRINGYTVDHYERGYQVYAFLEKKFLVSAFRVENGSFELTTLDKSPFGLLVYGHRQYDGYGFAGNFVLI